ncbi:ATP-dependent protease ATPase subunit ClpY [uncultured Clostridium sp.]|nr:ATP-dependent protease ATPase subunit ClpY [uncultured Clostridium sp.]
MSNLTPRQIVEELNRYIIGQDNAKRMVAIALRNRYRRSQLPEEIREEITPKNILMIGPTGVGKTEIARRLAKLVQAPFVKVEATKFTEVGYVGRDVESMIRDLVEASIRMVKQQRLDAVQVRAQANAEQRLLDLLIPSKKKKTTSNPFDFFTGANQQHEETPAIAEPMDEAERTRRQAVLDQLRRGELDNRVMEIEVDDQPRGLELVPGMNAEINMQDILGGILPKQRKRRKVTLAEARKILEQEEAQKLIDMDEVTAEAVERAEQDGIIFLDEIDKVAGKNMSGGPDVSREGVQRDILPIVEGSTVMTKYGPVKTDYMLFIAAGAFHVSKVGDLIPELQGRFPIHVELQNLTREDMQKILTQPDNALIKQYAALLAVDNVEVSFDESAILAIADHAFDVNETKENIGARRLHTILENLLEDLSFEAGEQQGVRQITVDAAYVREHLGLTSREQDLKKYIL